MPGSVALPSTSLTRAIASRCALGALDDFDDDDLSRLRTPALRRGNHQILADAAILRLDEPDAALLVDAADDFAIGARDDVDDLAFRASAPVHADTLRRDAIAMQRLVHFARRQEQVVATGVGNEESIAIRMALDRARDEVELGDDA